MASFSLLISLFSLLLFSLSTAQPPPPSFKCATPTTTTCKAFADYLTPNATTLGGIQSLFQVKNLRAILGVNNLPLSTLPNAPVRAKQTIRVPFPCACANGTGMSNHVPVYTVVPGDGLYRIAADVFGGLVVDDQIAAVNNIVNKNVIKVGQKLWIPLPCSCDHDMDGMKVVHYGLLVAAGSTVEGIATTYGTTQETLMKLNGMTDPKKLYAGQILDVPLKACTSNVSQNSPDYPLLLANGTYAFTANNCVKCQCTSANNYTLQCEPSQLRPSKWSVCPATQCSYAQGNLALGNVTTTPSCKTCTYTGYNNQTILTSLADQSTCAALTPSSNNNNSANTNMQRWSSVLFFLFIQFLSLQRCL